MIWLPNLSPAAEWMKKLISSAGSQTTTNFVNFMLLVQPVRIEIARSWHRIMFCGVEIWLLQNKENDVGGFKKILFNIFLRWLDKKEVWNSRNYFTGRRGQKNIAETADSLHRVIECTYLKNVIPNFYNYFGLGKVAMPLAWKMRFRARL